MQNSTGSTKNVCKCPHHKAFPILIILLGLVFLLQAINILTAGFVAWFWPLILILMGVVKLTEKSGMCKCC